MSACSPSSGDIGRESGMGSSFNNDKKKRSVSSQIGVTSAKNVTLWRRRSALPSEERLVLEPASPAPRQQEAACYQTAAANPWLLTQQSWTEGRMESCRREEGWIICTSCWRCLSLFVADRLTLCHLHGLWAEEGPADWTRAALYVCIWESKKKRLLILQLF